MATMHTVRFIAQNGAVISEQTVAHGEDAELPSAPEVSGMVFRGWYGNTMNIQRNETVYTRYSEPTDTEFGDEVKVVQILSDSVGTIRVHERITSVLACTISQRLNGECTIELTSDSKPLKGIARSRKLQVGNLLFSITGWHARTENGTYKTTISGEHISYCLSDEAYDVEEFSYTGTATGCLGQILTDTPIRGGSAYYPNIVTLKVNKKTSRRALLMQLVALCDGELEYNLQRVNIVEHVGSVVQTELTETRNVTDIAMRYTASEGQNYDVTLNRRTELGLGDEISIQFPPLGIDTMERICGIEWNPYNYREFSITVGDYMEDINDALYDLRDRVDNTRDLIDSGSGGGGSSSGGTQSGWDVRSVSSLPANPDSRTIYLIQGEVTVS